MVRSTGQSTEGSASEPIRLRPVVDDLPMLTEYIEQFAESHRMSPGDTHALTLAAEELFANTIRHSEPPATSIEFSLAADHLAATAVYRDDGSAFDPTVPSNAEVNLPAAQRSLGGLGLHFIRRTMSTFHYRRIDGQNVVTLRRTLTQPGSQGIAAQPDLRPF